jgi:hypothetical protein
MRIQYWGFVTLLVLAAGPAYGEHLWTDATGRYTTEAALVDYDGETVVLKNVSGKLISIPIEKLSANDQAFLKNQAAFMAAPPPSNRNNAWVLRDGARLVGQVLDFCRTPLAVQRQFGRILVNGAPYKELSPIQQMVARKTVEYFDRVSIDNLADLESWAKRQAGDVREFSFDGVLLESPGGEKSAIPFFLFTNEDQESMRPSWEQWLAQEKVHQETMLAREASRRQETLLTQARARDYQREQFERELLELNAIQAGLISAWEVQLYPTYGNYGPPMQVLVPARTSLGARYEVSMRYPGYSTGPVAKVSRRWW